MGETDPTPCQKNYWDISMYVCDSNKYVATTMTPPPIPYGSASNLPLGNLDSQIVFHGL